MNYECLNMLPISAPFPFQFSNQGLQLLTMPQRMPLKGGAIPQGGQIGHLQTGVKSTTSVPVSLTTSKSCDSLSPFFLDKNIEKSL